MTKQDLIRKLTSRKFWSLLIGLVTSFLVLLNIDENTTAQVVAVVGAFGSVVTYILAEAYVDGQRAKDKEEEEKATN